MGKKHEQTPREKRAELEEALRVNRSLLRVEQAHVEYLGERLAACDVRIAEQERLKALHRANAANAPSRIPVIEATIAKQESELEALILTNAAPKKDERSLAERAAEKREWEEFLAWRKAQGVKS